MSDGATIEHEPLYMTDAEIIRRMGVPEKVARQTIRALDAMPRSTFPKKNPLWGGRRHWPSVRAYLENHEKTRMGPSHNQRGDHA